MIARAGQALTPTLQRSLITICVMMATIMQALDITIANVALPYMQGSLSATLDQVSWVLTSYIVAAAIMTAPVGWLAGRFGIKRVLVTCAPPCSAASPKASKKSCSFACCKGCSEQRWCRCPKP
jgi:DHA2 family multidrug resistance protein